MHANKQLVNSENWSQQWDPRIGKFPTKVSVTQQCLQSKVIIYNIISNILIKYFYYKFWSSFISFWIWISFEFENEFILI